MDGQTEKRKGLSLTVECQPVNVKRMLGLEDFCFATVMVLWERPPKLTVDAEARHNSKAALISAFFTVFLHLTLAL